MPGFPIRTPWDHSLVDSSPRPIAASHVLHRLLVPRHSPFALDNLTTKMLASTVQFSNNNQPHTNHTPHHPSGGSCAQMQEGPQKQPRPHTRRGSACSFRTQQGVHHQTQPHPPPSLPPPRKVAVLDIRWTVAGPSSPVSPPIEHPPPTTRGRRAPGPLRARCSLERR